jgi:divalent metal cation (Fe/Co/Zn/Cd) transporter
VGLAAALLSNQYYWWIDKVGAMVLAVYTITNWGKSVIENAASLVGQAAPPELVAKVTYMAFNHHQKIRKLDTVRAFLLGGLYFVEVDIELPEDMSLREAHDIGESLQNKLEALTEVERAYVHLDYESSHRPEHTIPGYMV